MDSKRIINEDNKTKKLKLRKKYWNFLKKFRFVFDFKQRFEKYPSEQIAELDNEDLLEQVTYITGQYKRNFRKTISD